jgi:hypothetical protein
VVEVEEDDVAPSGVVEDDANGSAAGAVVSGTSMSPASAVRLMPQADTSVANTSAKSAVSIRFTLASPPGRKK